MGEDVHNLSLLSADMPLKLSAPEDYFSGVFI